MAPIFGNGHDGDDDDNDEREAYNPPSHMRNLDNAIIGQSTAVLLHEDLVLPVDAEIEEGMLFHNKQDCLHAIKTYHVKRSLDFKIKKSDSE
ncbi:hypothetical protein A2U01_0014601, partial [Trifolium medium]|nr:hypothetical protein [Trifolium medium]